ncbi:oligopeptide transporter [Aspergillus fijiensis CBS 313.89]|uniref:Oligopeptide transporter n=1 Tax=Aspergillus fijiensis CBS 313.89 TaxID=1448319 RepID=A0A8G1RRG7_9EURO|nr:oligopeptide transporter [Aspergillus fijiensis CBS 313.89]RAK78892.1 oligopeptide transporter [Aspergillus fijiensis CBS 313.89]
MATDTKGMEKEVYAVDSDDKAEVESQTEVLRAAGIGISEDDPTEPVLTLRMWVLGVGFCIVASGLNTLYTLRNPSITISATVVLLLAYPLGKLWEKVVPAWNVPLGAWSFNLNPGPFNQKEHVLIYMMSNLSIYVRLGADVLTEQQKFYGYSAGWGFQMLITFGTFLIGFCLAGFFRALVVEPRELVWPGVLSCTALTTTLHQVGQGDVQGLNATWKISRYGFFSLAFCISFCWYWFPDFIFPALSYFTFPCWINPKSTVVNQLFGMTSGMGLLPITFDWSQISYVGSPLLIPSWAIVNVFAGLVFWIWIVAVACYYSNIWYTGHLPFQSSSVYDNTGAVYKASKVVSAATGYKLDLAKYKAYSPVYTPVTYALNMFGLSFATLSSLLVWTFLEKRDVMTAAARRIPKLVRQSFSSEQEELEKIGAHARVPTWWYLLTAIVALFVTIFAVEYWRVELHWYGVLLACAVAMVFYGPLALVYATSNLKINIDILCRIIAGFVFENRILANIWFFDIGYITTIKGLYFAQDMKLGDYCHVPPRKVFFVQVVGMIAGTLSSVCVLNWGLGHIEGVCTTTGVNGFTCPYSRTHFNTSLIWGAIGPRNFFNNGIGYHRLLYFFIIGAILPIPVYYLQRRYPNSLWRRVHVPLFLGGLNYLPPATGTNYGSWAVVGLTFGVLIRKRLYQWWYKYNFVLSSALDSSVSIAGVVIFFAIFYSGASAHFSWWGTEVYKDTCDYKGCSYLPIPEGGKFGVGV